VWFVAYSDGNARRRRPSESGREERQTESNGESKIYSGAYSNGNEGDVANTDSNGFDKRNCNDEKQPSERGEYALRDIESVYYKQSSAKHSDGIRQKRRLHKEQSKIAVREQFGERNARSFKSTGWDNFPTQSPICGGDDGLPTELDGITFSKWRNESIKAYGNAIVPQVAYQIFKAIQLTDENTRRKN
jgi:DNA (cytosine-5)-methyltransferase 1